MRTFSLGSDRYTRSYWLLSSIGGIFVEGADTSNRKDGGVKKAQRLSVIEEGSVVTPGRKRKLSFKSEACGDDVFESPVVKKLKEEDETESDVDTMNLSLLSDVCQQAKELNSQDETTSSPTQTPGSTPSPPTHNEPHQSSPKIPPQNTSSATSQPIRSCVITGNCPQENKTTGSSNCSKENSVEPNNVGSHNENSDAQNVEDDKTDVQEAQSYVNSQQPTMAYLSNGSVVYSTMPPQGSVQYVIPQQGGYMIQDPSTGAVTGDSALQYLQAGQLIQGPDGVQYLAVQNNMMSSLAQSHNLAYIQMENGEQQLCVINNGGVIGNNETTTLDISDGAVYSMSVPMMEAMNNEVECMPYRHDILLLMLEMSMQCQPTQEEKDTGPSLEELLSQVNPSEFMCVYKINIQCKRVIGRNLGYTYNQSDLVFFKLHIFKII